MTGSRDTARSENSLFHCVLARMWFVIAAGAAALAHILPQTRNQVKDVPWMPLAIAVGLGVLSDSINNGIKSIGTESMAHFEERYDTEVLQDATGRCTADLLHTAG